MKHMLYFLGEDGYCLDEAESSVVPDYKDIISLPDNDKDYEVVGRKFIFDYSSDLRRSIIGEVNIVLKEAASREDSK